MAEIELLCAGNAMVDVFAEVSGGALRSIRERFGLDRPVQHVGAEKAAAILDALPQTPQAADAAALPHTILASGGGAANTAKIAARLGIKSAFAGCTGADAFGAFFKEELSAAGVRTFLRTVSKPTGVFITITGKDGGAANAAKTIAASPSAALELGAEDLRCFAPDVESGASGRPKILLFEGFLTDRPALVRRCVDLAGECGAVLAFDPGTADIAARRAADILGWPAGAGRRFVLFANEAEAEALAAAAGGRRGASSGWETLFSGLSADAAGFLAAVKLAERGAVVFSGGETYRVETRPVAGAESTGAGDAFAAGFLAALLRGESPAACGAAGNAAAATTLRAPGTGTPRPANHPEPGNSRYTIPARRG